MKITGYITAQVEAGTLDKQYVWAGAGGTSEAMLAPGASIASRPDIGYTTRGELEFITKSNTAYGVLTGDIDTQFNYGSGFDNTGAGNGFINHAFLNWAGITAGKANSFFSFFGGGEGWANIFSPDQQGYNQPLLLAYTATFGGGFSATVSLQDPILGGPSGGGVDAMIAGNAAYQGIRSPDIVASIDLAQGWGGAHLAGLAHYVNVVDGVGNTQSTWGWALDGGVKFNLPSLGAGDNIALQASWSRNAVWYSGIMDAMWGENGQVNGNGVVMPVADSYSNYNGSWATPNAWSIGATSEFHLGPTFSIDPEAAYAQLQWTGLNGPMAGALSTNSQSWVFGSVFHWDPVAHLDFNLELLYQTTHQSTPAAFVGTAAVPTWKATSSGLEGRFEITRDF